MNTILQFPDFQKLKTETDEQLEDWLKCMFVNQKNVTGHGKAFCRAVIRERVRRRNNK